MKLATTLRLLACIGLGLTHAQAIELTYTDRENTLEWFEGARLGIFLHWDARSDCSKVTHPDNDLELDIRPASKAMQEVAMWGPKGSSPDPMPWQDWNPHRFNAEEWVDVCLSSGAKYFCFTTMHMWNLSNFDHPATDYDIMSTPFARDCAEELAQAAKGKDIVPMWYFNMWPSKHIKDKGIREKHFWSLANEELQQSRNWEDFRKAGLHNLLLNTDKYGKVAGVWCDGGGTFTDEGAEGFYDAILDVQPWLIFSPRHGHPDMPKDYKVPEQKMPSLNWTLHQEMTMPIESDMWFWTHGKKSNTKDAEYTIQTLIQTATRDANLMINVSPRGDGAIDDTQATVLTELGKWVAQYGESIFDTRAGPYEPGLWGGSTRKGKTVYLHLTQLSEDGSYQFPDLPAKVRSARLLHGNPVTFKQGSGQLRIELDPSLAGDRNVIDRIVVLELDKDAWEMLPENVLPTTKKDRLLKAEALASSENTYKRPSGKETVDHADAVLSTAEGHGGWSASEPWSEPGTDPNPWLMLDFGSKQDFSRVFLKEYHSRIQEYVLEYADSEKGPWKTLHKGQRLNHLSLKTAKPVSAQYVRLRFPKTEGGAPQISQFHCYN